jgi:hypothetical protein
MDDIVRQAIAKWPNVPHCYGWLGLDARGGWRMRDERAQHLHLAGDKLSNPALVGFITRNYGHDERGCWFFQNGPQRVYVNLEATPYIARSDPAQGWLLHTGAPLGVPAAAYLTEAGELILCRDGIVAQLDDRDFAQVLPALELDGATVSDEDLLAWLDDGAGMLALRCGAQSIAVQRLPREQVSAHFGFVREPASVEERHASAEEPQ